MTREQYEDQKRRLADQHRSLVEMVDSAYQTQLQALDMVWRMLSGEGSPGPRPAAPPPPAPPEPAVAAPPARRRRRAGELFHAVLAALPHLPDPFVFSDICRLLGYTPDRGSLYRTLQELKDAGSIVICAIGSGTHPTQYRRVLPRENESGA